jgi:predicted Zn-dependent protease
MADDPQVAKSTSADIFDQIAEKIIEQQEAIIGPIAVDQAKSVKSLKIDWPQHAVDVSGDPKKAIDDLVEQYKELFGQLAVESCKQAANKLIAQLPANQQPASLK